MSKDWDCYATEMAGKAAVVFVDMGIAEDAPIERLPVAAWVQVQMLQPDPEGLLAATEAGAFDAIESALKARLVTKFTAYVGRVVSDGRCDFHFYTAAATGWKEQVAGALSEFPAYRFHCGSRPDRDWGIYFERLSPADEDLVCLRNRRICDTLQRSGDRLEQARPIEHWAYFPDAQARARFEVMAAELGCEVVDRIDPEDPGDQFGVRVSVSAVPSHRDIDALVLPLHRAASACDGEYEGWETQVVGD